MAFFPHIEEKSSGMLKKPLIPIGKHANGFKGDLITYLEEGVEVAVLSTGTAALGEVNKANIILVLSTPI